MLRAVTLVLTVLTGATGLVYEVAWQKYLATLLGSHSEATAAVLGIFLAGLSAGYSIFGRISKRIVDAAVQSGRPPKLLLAYGLAEAGIGVYALIFPSFFAVVQSISAGLGFDSSGASFAFDVLLAAVLLLPPAVLMGGTIPMLTQGLSRSAADSTRLHALVYGFNTAGAFVGAMLAGFALVPWLGLVRVMYATAAINLAVGVFFVVAGRRGGASGEVAEEAAGAARLPGFAVYCTISALVGFAMMTLQTTLIRIGGLSFGSSEYTFATVVSVFVASIALGSFLVSALPRVPPALLSLNQWALAALVALLYLYLDEAGYWVHQVRIQFGADDADFYPYYLSGAALIGVVVGPAVVLSGATLPLLFHTMRRQVVDLGALAGQIYSWNTVGSFFGALIGGYALLFWLDLHQVYRIAVAALVIAAALASARQGFLEARRATGVGVAALCGVALLPGWSPEMMSSGLFRERAAFEYSEGGAERAALRRPSVVFYEDDPIMSVTVREFTIQGQLVRSIATNGKNDGSTGEDYITMALAGLIPALLADEPRTAFVIGLGTGVTAGELAELDSIRRVVVAEISPAVIRAGPWFDFANFNVSSRRDVEIVRSDAYRALLRSDERFSLIVSEPSNPWVTGVEMLFSKEFLTAARNRLEPGGVYAQWYHEYETDDAVLELVLRTYLSVFDNVAIWYAASHDLILLGFQSSAAEIDLERATERARRPDYRAGLERSGLESIAELLTHELVPLGVASQLGLQGPVHGLYHPRLSHAAGRAFFRGSGASLPFSGWGEPARMAGQRSLLRSYLESRPGRAEHIRSEALREACSGRRTQCVTLLGDWYARDPGSRELAALVRKLFPSTFGVGDPDPDNPWQELAALFTHGPAIVPRQLPRATELFVEYYDHSTPFDADKLLAAWDQCDEGIPGVRECARERSRVRALLDQGERDASPAARD